MIYLTVVLYFAASMLFAEDFSPVSNLKIESREKTAVFDIYYDIIDPNHQKLYVTIYGSSNNGVSWNVEVKNVNGDTGLVRTGRGKHIVWNAETDYPQQYSTAFRIMIKARNRMCPQRGDEGMSFIPAGQYKTGDTTLEVSDYCIDRWEFPNVKGNYPDVYVTYDQASDSCYNLGKRLCTELQWEYACAGKVGSTFPYGWNYFKERCNTDGDTTHLIGVDRSCVSDFGVFDLSGNVFEWISDAYEPTLKKKQEPIPQAHAASVQKRGIRGGYFGLGESYSRCTDRGWEWPKNATRHLGFRCCYTFSND